MLSAGPAAGINSLVLPLPHGRPWFGTNSEQECERCFRKFSKAGKINPTLFCLHVNEIISFTATQ